MYNIKTSGYENFGQCAVQRKNGYTAQKKNFPCPHAAQKKNFFRRISRVHLPGACPRHAKAFSVN